MKSAWTPEKQAISTLRIWVILLLGGLVIGAIGFVHNVGSVKQAGESSPSDGATNHKPEKTIAAKIADDPVALFTLVLSVFTGGLFWATQTLASSTKELVRDAKETSRATLRAYIYVVPQRLFITRDFRIACEYNITNGGPNARAKPSN